MIRIKSKNTLAALLGLQPDRLLWLADNTAQFFGRYTLINPASPGKDRDVLEVRGVLRRIQDKLLRRLFCSCFESSPNSHGGVAGRSIKTNAGLHLGASWVFTTDISAFYPSVHRCRVYRFFEDQGCSPPVARILTKLCTHDDHLALGLITSPMLADQLFRPIDVRLCNLASASGLQYTQYVDDITFSGGFDFGDSGIPALVVQVVSEHGFAVKQSKHKMGRAHDPSLAVTQLRLKSATLDVRKEYVEKLTSAITALESLSVGGQFVTEYITRSQLEGRVRFVCWVNPGRRRHLLPLMSRLKWQAIESEAEARGLVVQRKALIRRV